jgi:hypothetical protein
MKSYKLTTLVDITRTYPSRSETDPLKLNQQANFNSLMQAINLRANVEETIDPVFNDGRLPEPLKGKANHWVFEFTTERDDIFLKDNNPVGHLIDDLNGVPVIPNLTNSQDIDPPVFITKGKKTNIWINTIV